MATRKTTLALMLALAACSRGKSPPTEGPQPRIERADDPVPYQYLVVLKPGGGASADVARELIASHDASVLRSYDRALRGFAMHASEETAVAIARDSRVAWVAEDGRVKAQAISWQENAPAGLDRIDQRTGTNGRYGYHGAAGERVHAYVLDTGILASHLEFLARPPEQVDFVRDGGIGDCNGHGTYVAALVGGTTWGAAKKVTLHSLRVLGCDAAGTTSDAVAALDWLLANAQTPAVANLSFGRGGDAALDAAVAGNHTEVVRLLLEHHASVNVRSSGGMTPLQKAAQNGNLEVCRLLLEKGADVAARDDAGKTPLGYAIEGKHEAVALLLRERGAAA